MKKRLKKLVAALSVYYDKWVSEWASISQKPEVSSAAPGWLFFLYALLTFFLPWSVEVTLGDMGLIRLPSEVFTMAAGIGLVWYLWKNAGARKSFFPTDSISRLALLWWLWLSVCVFFSSMPLVSLKYWVVETGQFFVFFIGLSGFSTWRLRLLALFTISMAGVVVFIMGHHAFYHFRADQSMLATLPFFPDHTLYSAVLVMLLPIVWIVFRPRVACFFTILFIAALILASCRAAWLSLALAFGCLAPAVFMKKRSVAGLVYVAGAGVIVALLPFFKEKIDRDVSSLERLNRYACAWRMAEQRPLTGWGPGTFQFQYLSFQQPEEMTRISITDPARDLRPDQMGRGGGAHSEYFQALAETGWPGLLWRALLIIAAAVTGIQAWHSAPSKEQQWLALAVTFALLTFFIHALFNNFWHDGRVAWLVWGLLSRKS
ncbi:MAG: O-antigen ligase family protein [Saprospiraceae bacterium]|nr:O-antigen ligase family protein [Saprospiraceae bacterium]